jgi:hypothetical protein
MRDHIRIEELYAARALVGLDEHDAEELARSVAAHGDDCPECGRLQDEYEEVAGRLAFALAPERVPEGMADRILGEERLGTRERRSPRSFRRAVAAVAAALLLGVGALGGYLLAPRAVPGLTEAAAYLSEPGVRISNLEGSGRGNLVLAFRPGSEESYLIGSEVPPAPEGKVYEVWLMRDDGVLPAATFTPERDVLVVRVPEDPSDVARVAVTLELAPGAPQPTTAPIFEAPITLS